VLGSGQEGDQIPWLVSPVKCMHTESGVGKIRSSHEFAYIPSLLSAGAGSRLFGLRLSAAY